MRLQLKAALGIDTADKYISTTSPTHRAAGRLRGGEIKAKDIYLPVFSRPESTCIAADGTADEPN